MIADDETRFHFEPTELGYMLNLENKKSKKQKITDKDYRKLKIKQKHTPIYLTYNILYGIK